MLTGGYQRVQYVGSNTNGQGTGATQGQHRPGATQGQHRDFKIKSKSELSMGPSEVDILFEQMHGKKKTHNTFFEAEQERILNMTSW